MLSLKIISEMANKNPFLKTIIPIYLQKLQKINTPFSFHKVYRTFPYFRSCLVLIFVAGGRVAGVRLGERGCRPLERDKVALGRSVLLRFTQGDWGRGIGEVSL